MSGHLLRRMKGNTAAKGNHVDEHDENGCCSSHPACQPVDEYVLLSDLAAEYGEEKVREFAHCRWGWVAQVSIGGMWCAPARSTALLFDQWLTGYRVPLAAAQEFLAAMKEKIPPFAGFVPSIIGDPTEPRQMQPNTFDLPGTAHTVPHKETRACAIGVQCEPEKPKAQDCPVCGGKAKGDRCVDGMAYGCSAVGCPMGMWFDLGVWNRLRLAPEE
jgi:hypothetical protein